MNKERSERLRKLANLPDEKIDFSDIPEVTNFTGWTKLHHKKKDIHAAIDEDILSWVK